MRKKPVVFLSMLLALSILFTIVRPQHTSGTTGVGYLLPTQPGALNPAPKVIPRLREWRGGFGFFTLSPASRIVIAPSYAGQLKATAQVFQNDLFAEIHKTLPVATLSSPGIGDFFLTLDASDPTLGNEGYLFQVTDQV